MTMDAIPQSVGLIERVLEPGFDAAATIAEVSGNDIGRAYDTARNSLLPLTTTDPELKGRVAKEIDTALRPIGAKISPHLSPAQASAWRDAMLIALSNLPGRIALTATRRAIHEPMQALWDVELEIRKIATGLLERQRLAAARLKAMLDEIERGLNPPAPQLPAPDPGMPITNTEIRALTPDLRALGLAAGHITQEQIDAAFAEEDAVTAS